MVVGCATKIQTEFNEHIDFSQYRAFSWLAPKAQEVRNPILDSELLIQRVRRATIDTLKARGFEEDNNNPDFYVTCHTATRSILRPTLYGVGVGYSRFHRYWGHTVIVEEPVVSTYEEGVLIIDIIDGTTDTLIWRGWDTDLLTPKNYSEEAVAIAVQRILQQFPPERSASTHILSYRFA